jgi:hypothetical protein
MTNVQHIGNRPHAYMWSQNIRHRTRVTRCSDRSQLTAHVQRLPPPPPLQVMAKQIYEQSEGQGEVLTANIVLMTIKLHVVLFL